MKLFYSKLEIKQFQTFYSSHRTRFTVILLHDWFLSVSMLSKSPLLFDQFSFIFVTAFHIKLYSATTLEKNFSSELLCVHKRKIVQRVRYASPAQDGSVYDLLLPPTAPQKHSQEQSVRCFREGG